MSNKKKNNKNYAELWLSAVNPPVSSENQDNVVALDDDILDYPVNMEISNEFIELDENSNID